MIAFVFPGQGSQKRGMGEGVFDQVREYASVENDVDEILGYSLRKQCLEDTGNRLRETQFTQPCLYAVNMLHYYKAVNEGPRPAYLAGHSLGEYSALLAAGVFDFLTGLRLVKKRGELMAEARNGGMAAVIGLSASTIERLITENGLASLDIANFNTASQIVLSGPVEDIKLAAPIFEKAGARTYMPLQVSAAFHSRYMADAAKAFAEFVKPMSFAAPQTPVVANATAQLYPTQNASESVKALLVKQITDSVQWSQSIRWIIRQGVTQFSEMGPGNVLTRLGQQIQREEASESVLAAAGR
jgi:malonyl CoA-acyl carrier protein transacylase